MEQETKIIFQNEKGEITMTIRPLYKCYRVFISDSPDAPEGYILDRSEVDEVIKEYTAKSMQRV